VPRLVDNYRQPGPLVRWLLDTRNAIVRIGHDPKAKGDAILGEVARFVTPLLATLGLEPNISSNIINKSTDTSSNTTTSTTTSTPTTTKKKTKKMMLTNGPLRSGTEAEAAAEDEEDGRRMRTTRSLNVGSAQRTEVDSTRRRRVVTLWAEQLWAPPPP